MTCRLPFAAIEGFKQQQCSSMLCKERSIMVFDDGPITSVLEPFEVVIDVEIKRRGDSRQKSVFVHHRFGITRKRPKRIGCVGTVMEHTTTEVTGPVRKGF